MAITLKIEEILMIQGLSLFAVMLTLVCVIGAPIIRQKVYLEELRRSMRASFFWFIVAVVIATLVGWSSLPFAVALGAARLFFAGCFGLIALIALIVWAHFLSRLPI